MHQQPGPAQSTKATLQLNTFRDSYYDCFTARADELSELTDALMRAQGKATDLTHLSLKPEHQRGHGALYDGINHGQLKTLITTLPIGKFPAGNGRSRIVLAVDVSNWPRPHAACTPDRAFCHTCARDGSTGMIPGWPYAFVVALEPGGYLVDHDPGRPTPGPRPGHHRGDRHPDPGNDRTIDHRRAVTHPWQPWILIVMDAGYDVARLAWLLADVPVVLVARGRSNRVFYAPAGPRQGPTKGAGTTPRNETELGCSCLLPGPGPHVHPRAATVRASAGSSLVTDAPQARYSGRDRRRAR